MSTDAIIGFETAVAGRACATTGTVNTERAMPAAPSRIAKGRGYIVLPLKKQLAENAELVYRPLILLTITYGRKQSVWREPQIHSARRASIGSTRSARRIGTSEAMSATADSRSATPANTIGSVGLI